MVQKKKKREGRQYKANFFFPNFLSVDNLFPMPYSHSTMFAFVLQPHHVAAYFKQFLYVCSPYQVIKCKRVITWILLFSFIYSLHQDTISHGVKQWFHPSRQIRLTVPHFDPTPCPPPPPCRFCYCEGH